MTESHITNSVTTDIYHIIDTTSSFKTRKLRVSAPLKDGVFLQGGMGVELRLPKTPSGSGCVPFGAFTSKIVYELYSGDLLIERREYDRNIIGLSSQKGGSTYAIVEVVELLTLPDDVCHENLFITVYLDLDRSIYPFCESLDPQLNAELLTVFDVEISGTPCPSLEDCCTL